jgi:hypothetical protein
VLTLRFPSLLVLLAILDFDVELLGLLTDLLLAVAGFEKLLSLSWCVPFIALLELTCGAERDGLGRDTVYHHPLKHHDPYVAFNVIINQKLQIQIYR